MRVAPTGVGACRRGANAGVSHGVGVCEKEMFEDRSCVKENVLRLRKM